MNQKVLIEWNILIGLFRATSEQSNMLTGQTKREAKMIFNRWVYESCDLDLEEVTQKIENSVHELRKN